MFPILLVSIFVVVLLGIFLLLYFLKDEGRGRSSGNRNLIKIKDRSSIIKSAKSKLAQNPQDPKALLSLAELYFKEEDYEKASKYFSTLDELDPGHSGLDKGDIEVKLALSNLRLKNYSEAYRGLSVAKVKNPDSFEINFNLGYLEYLLKNYEVAIGLLTKARETRPDHVQPARYLGLCLLKARRFRESVRALKTALTVEPSDRDSLYALAQCYYEMGHNDRALKIFRHLRVHPKLGPNASLFCGSLNLAFHNYGEAITDFEIGLRHRGIKPEIEVELKYRLAKASIMENQIDRAVELLRDIIGVNPDYKDCRELIGKYQEMSKSRHLQTYLLAPTSEFVSLCRRIASFFFSNAKTKLVDISIVKNEYVDILAEIATPNWENNVLFRFIRSTGVVGELVTREFYTRCRDLKCGRGYCLTAGTYSEGARHFVEARVLDLIAKEGLIKLFHKISLPDNSAKRLKTSV